MGIIYLKTAPHMRVHLEKEDSARGYWTALRRVYGPQPAEIRKSSDKLATVQAPTMGEALVAAQVIAALRSNNTAPTIDSNRQLAALIHQTLLSTTPKPHPMRRRQRGELQSCNLQRKPMTPTADQSAKALKGKQVIRSPQHAGPSRLMVSPPSHGIPQGSKPNSAQHGQHWPKRLVEPFPEYCNRNPVDKLGVPVNTLRQSAVTPTKRREQAPMSYKDVLSTKTAPENPSADDWLLDLLIKLQVKDGHPESQTVDSGMVDQVPSTQVPKRRQRSQQKKLIQTVSLNYDRPKTKPLTAHAVVTPKKELLYIGE